MIWCCCMAVLKLGSPIKCSFDVRVVWSKNFTLCWCENRIRAMLEDVDRLNDSAVWMYVMYKVVQIWPGQTVTCLRTNRPGHIWTTLYVAPTFVWTAAGCQRMYLCSSLFNYISLTDWFLKWRCHVFFVRCCTNSLSKYLLHEIWTYFCLMWHLSGNTNAT